MNLTVGQYQNLPDFQKRVVDETVELNSKLDKLNNFIGNNIYEKLDNQDRLLLLLQRDAMKSYFDILNQRIERFKEK